MTEEEWLNCTDPAQMLVYLHTSSRKLRLLACECCRLVWPLLDDARSRAAIEVSERFADGQATLMELEIARAEARAAIPTKNPARGVSVGGKAWRQARMKHSLTRAAWDTTTNPIYFIGTTSTLSAVWQLPSIAEQRGLLSIPGNEWLCHILRDFFTNPFRSVVIASSWRASTVLSLAQTIYEQRQFENLPILADALEDAGCTNADILNHCRQPGEHVRGCWVVDLVLGKK